MSITAARIQMRRGTLAEWNEANPVLASGEIGYVTDTREFKWGNGVTPWLTLPFFGSQGPMGPEGPAGADGAPGEDGADGASATSALYDPVYDVVGAPCFVTPRAVFWIPIGTNSYKVWGNVTIDFDGGSGTAELTGTLPVPTEIAYEEQLVGVGGAAGAGAGISLVNGVVGNPGKFYVAVPIVNAGLGYFNFTYSTLLD